MENLQGGTLALEHRYMIDSTRTRVGFVSRYEATQSPFDAPVWVDVFDALDDIPDPEPIIERLEATARRTASLSGNGILKVCDYGELDRNVPFVVSERVDGESLATRIDRQPLDTGETARLVRRLAHILQRAHDQGIAHGRLAPRWIYLPDDDLERATIGHFEIGPTLGELRRMDNVVLTPTMVDAFPPEAFDRPTRPPDIDDDAFDPTREFDETADTYALGLVAYICLIGHHPFFDEDSTDASDGIARVQHDDPQPPESFGVDPAVSDCILRALARTPDERWASPNDFAETLCREAGVALPPTVDASSDDDPADLTHEQSPSDDASDPSDEQPDASSPSSGPGPASTAMTIAVAGLLVTNVCWFLFWYLADTPESSANIQLDTRPSGASVHRSNPSGESIGTTPISIQPSTRAPQPLDLFIDKPGYQPTTITVSEHQRARHLDVHLRRRPDGHSQPTGDQPSNSNRPGDDAPLDGSDGGPAPDSNLQ